MAKTKTAKGATKPTKVAEKAVHELASLLDEPYYASDALEPYVEKLGEPKGLALAEAALGRVKKGLKRTYLAARVAEAKGDAAAAAKLANQFCAGFAALDRGRIPLGVALCAVVGLATDVSAAHAALRNLEVADPYFSKLFDPAAANADARGDASAAAAYRARGETFGRLRPTLLALRQDGDDDDIAKAIASVDAMPEGDRRDVLRRVTWRPEAFDHGIVRRGVEATIDDDTVSSAAWAMALGAVGDDDEDSDASKALRARVQADDAVIERLVRRVVSADEEWPPTLDDDNDLDEDAVYRGACTALHALRERAGDPRVWSIAERAFAGGKERARLQRAVMETFLHGLHCGPQAWPAMTDAQARAAFTWLWKAAGQKPHENDARHALFYWARQGVEDLVEQALEEETNGEVVENLYSAAYHIDAKDLLVRRIPKERKEFWRLQNAIGEVWTPEWHKAILDQLDAWGDPRLAEIYGEALCDHVKKNGAIVDLLRRVMAWPAPSGDAARYAKRVFMVGAHAALETRAYALAREAWERAQAIKGLPLSNEYTTERKTKVPELFVGDEGKKRLKRLLSGELDKEEERERARVAEARASGKPRKATDATLSALASADVELRVFDDPATREVLFLDAEGELRFYDGYALADAPWALEPLDALGAALAGAARCDQRALAWDKPGRAWREIARWGKVVMVLWGLNNDYAPKGRVARFADEDAARAFYEKVRAAPPDGFAWGTAWHAEGRGGVAREYTHAGTDADDDSVLQAVVGARWSWGSRRFDSPEEAERAYEAWELDLYKKGARLKNLEWMERLKRDEDMTLREWLDERARDDNESIRWHMDALVEFERALRAQRVWPDGAEVSVGPAVPADAIDAFAAEVEVLPAGLRELWEHTGRASWKLGARAQRVLAPDEVRAYRPKMAAWLDRVAPKWGSRRKQFEPVWRECDALVVDQDDAPVIVARCKKGGQGPFTEAHADKPQNAYWTDGLAWHLCTTFTDALVHALAGAEPLIAALRYGERAPEARKTVSLSSGEKVWHGVFDEAGAAFITVAGKKGGALRAARKSFKDAAAARKAFDAAVKAKRGEGFR